MRASKTLSELKRERGLVWQQDDRPSASRRGYGSRWQKARLTFLKRNSLCVECQREGRTALATVVDHITPHRGDKKLFWDRNNWQPLCAEHHNRKTAKEDGGFGNKKRQH